jgi:hypothetical protein
MHSVSRPSKVAHVKASYPEFAGQLEVVEIEEISTGDFSKALEGMPTTSCSRFGMLIGELE